MHRFFVPDTARSGTFVTLPEAAARQIARVLRLRPGEEIVLIPADGRNAVEWRVRLGSVAARAVTGVVVAERAALPEPRCAVTLYPALLKGERFDWLLQKATELGVTAIRPVLTRHTVRRVSGEDGPALERWRRIVTEAAEQSGRGAVPRLFPPGPVGHGPPRDAHDLTVIGLEHATARSFAALVGPAVRSVGILTGPEGGFAADEIAAITADGWIQSVTLGPRTLRAETAGIVAMTLALAASGDLGPAAPREWRPLDTNSIGAE